MKYRKRKLITEKKSLNNQFLNRFGALYYRELLRENRFYVNLESDNENITIHEDNVQAVDFFEDNSGNSFITISCVIFILDKIWVNHFKKINICQISFLDATGSVVKFLDYDVLYESLKYNISYNSDNPLTIKIKYKII